MIKNKHEVGNNISNNISKNKHKVGLKNNYILNYKYTLGRLDNIKR
jgi:hypothetical protein